jgi:hypothetical protein
MPIEQQFNLMAPYFEILLRTILKRLNNNEYPKEFFELEKIADSVPSIFFDEYEKELDSYIMGMELLGFDKEQ